MKRPAVFFDRDGTLMEDTGYCADPADVRVFSGASAAIGRLKQAGFRAILITNQSGIGRGYITVEQYRAVEAEFLRQLGPDCLDASYFCADLPDTKSPWRKPAPGMVLRAAAEFEIDLAASWFIGDKDSDIECGRRARTRTVLVLTGYGAQAAGARPDFRARDVAEAAGIILGGR